MSLYNTAITCNIAMYSRVCSYLCCQHCSCQSTPYSVLSLLCSRVIFRLHFVVPSLLSHLSSCAPWFLFPCYITHYFFYPHSRTVDCCSFFTINFFSEFSFSSTCLSTAFVFPSKLHTLFSIWWRLFRTTGCSVWFKYTVDIRFLRVDR